MFHILVNKKRTVTSRGVLFFFEAVSSARRAGFEPATNWLHVLPKFPFGVDYIITLVKTP